MRLSPAQCKLITTEVVMPKKESGSTPVKQKTPKQRDLARVKPSNSTTLVRQPAEFNLANLNLISVQERIPEKYTSWSTTFKQGDRIGLVSCMIPEGVGGVPHGLDADIMNAINDLFIDAGAPEDGVLHTTAYQIIARANLRQTGPYYRMLKESLVRLMVASYFIKEHWRDHGESRYTDAKFNLILESQLTNKDKSGLDSKSTVSLTLAKPIVRSIRAKYTKPVNSLVLNRLTRTFSRSLYRLLDAKRRDPVSLEATKHAHQLSLFEWATECRLTETENAAQIKKLLNNAHKDLMDVGYLDEVIYEGRGKNTTITYKFNRSELVGDPAVTALEHDMHVSFKLAPKNSQKLITAYGVAHVRERVEVAREVLRAGTWRPKSMGAWLTSVIKADEAQYAEILEKLRPQASRGAPSTARQSTDETAVVQDPHVEFEKTLTTLEREDLIESVLRVIQVTLRDYLSGPEFSMIRTAMERGVLHPNDVRANDARALRDGTREAFARELMLRVHQPPQPLL